VRRKPPLLHQPDQGGDEALRLGVTEREPDDPLGAEQPVDAQGDLGAERRGADDDQGAAGGERVDTLAQDADVAGGLHHTVHALTAGDLRERLTGVALPRDDGVGDAQLLGELQAFGHPVDGDDGGGGGGAEGGRHDRRQTDGSGTEDHDRAAVDRLQHVPDGTDTCLHTAAQRGDRLRRYVRVDLDEAALVGRRPFGERGLAEESAAARLAVAGGATRRTVGGAVGPRLVRDRPVDRRSRTVPGEPWSCAPGAQPPATVASC